VIRIAVILLAFSAACDVGTAAQSGGGPDGGGGGAKMDGSGSNVAQCVDPVNPPPASHTHTNPAIAGNPTNQGLDCLSAGCHNAGGGGGQYQFAGTIYTTAGGTTPAPGVTIRVSFGGSVTTATSDDKGNFYAVQAVTFGVGTTADVTSCPTITPMVTKLTIASNGGCNGCHAPGGTQSAIGLQ
jgi:hypothetical protein